MAKKNGISHYQGLFEVSVGLGYAVGPPIGGLLYQVSTEGIIKFSEQAQRAS